MSQAVKPRTRRRKEPRKNLHPRPQPGSRGLPNAKDATGQATSLAGPLQRTVLFLPPRNSALTPSVMLPFTDYFLSPV